MAKKNAPVDKKDTVVKKVDELLNNGSAQVQEKTIEEQKKEAVEEINKKKNTETGLEWLDSFFNQEIQEAAATNPNTDYYAKLVSMYPTKGTIVLRVKDPKYSGEFFTAYPIAGANGKLLKEQKDLSPAERENVLKVVDSDTSLKLRDGRTFVLSDEIDRIDWGWLKYSPMIAPNKTMAMRSAKCWFYVENVLEESKAKIELEDRRATTIYQVKEMKDEQRAAILVCLGKHVGKHEENKAKIYDIITSDFNQGKSKEDKTTVEYLVNNPLYLKQAVSVRKLIEKKYIKVENGLFWYNGNAIATKFEDVLLWLSSDSASVLRSAIEQNL